MNRLTRNKTLLICPSVGLWRVGGKLYFDRKFYDGLVSYQKIWSSKLKVLMRLDCQAPPQFGLIEYNEAEAPFQLAMIEANATVTADYLVGADIVLASADDFRQMHVSALCKRLCIKCVYVIEYTIKTRIQITMLNRASIWQKCKSVAWLILQEIRLRKALRCASSMQSNGVPAYNQYATLVPNPLLYFDTRNSTAMLVTQQALENRLSYLDQQQPIRLGFSGRLIEMKGASDLIELAHILDKRGMAFSFDIFGAGEQANAMLERIKEYGLQDKVKLHGAVDYETELVPFVRSSLDIFICCHKQGDPSCTYLETYACGVPIAGYANEAHAGILARVNVGWKVPIGNINELARLIESLDKNREQIKTKAKAAINFAKAHTFEATFEARIKHCVNVVGES